MTSFFENLAYWNDVTVMTSSTQNQFFETFLVNTNPHAEIGVSISFGLEVR